ncbi:MAG: hypothetical protein JMDDDDMK_00307 [Acidobacteria bacterium]|nr:hypothetical protein [Acidobacteriota bacterium]
MAVFEQRLQDGMFAREFLQRPFARVLDLNADPGQRLFDLRRAVQIDPRRRDAKQIHLRRPGAKLPMQLFRDLIVFDSNAVNQIAPAFDIQINARQFQRRD